ncbi:hypothetical protein EBS57_09890 [bacterium]|nr:hypothetical protein [bacterium]
MENYEDLSEVRVVVRGSRAGRRLLEKLAVEADRQKRPLFLPKIATIARIVDELFTAPSGLLPAAPELTQKIAWMEALCRLPQKKKSKLFQTPEGVASHRKKNPNCFRHPKGWDEVVSPSCCLPSDY